MRRGRVVFLLFVKPERSARIHNTVGIEMVFQSFQHIHLNVAELFCVVRREEFADAMVVTDACARFLNRVKHAAVELLELFDALVLLHPDEVKVCAVLIAVRDMAGADDVGVRFNELSDVVVNVIDFVPGHCTFKSVDDNAEVLIIVAHIGIGETSRRPFRHDDAGQERRQMMFSRVLFDVSYRHTLIIGIAVAETDDKTAFSEFESERLQKSFDFAKSVHSETKVAFFAVGNSEYGRYAAFSLHNVAHKRNAAVPIARKIAERVEAVTVLLSSRLLIVVVLLERRPRSLYFRP